MSRRSTVDGEIVSANGFDMFNGGFKPGAECLCSNKADELNLGLEQLLSRAAFRMTDKEVTLALWRWMGLIRDGYFNSGEEGEPLPPKAEDGRAFAEKMKSLRDAIVKAGLTFECRN